MKRVWKVSPWLAEAAEPWVGDTEGCLVSMQCDNMLVPRTQFCLPVPGAPRARPCDP